MADLSLTSDKGIKDTCPVGLMSAQREHYNKSYTTAGENDAVITKKQGNFTDRTGQCPVPTNNKQTAIIYLKTRQPLNRTRRGAFLRYARQTKILRVPMRIIKNNQFHSSTRRPAMNDWANLIIL